ncbi:O-methyltransferase MdmC-like isoform X3 [Panicum virgatum]|uniref:O-methyltransferase MdmC-like isoform X3 n=1 Tax=Panicum virgatum TaxID=38727 RepID=UPI0019D55317|nr:O-methyltransferase MdmC-like isoform X3 [Panicum virgatum]
MSPRLAAAPPLLAPPAAAAARELAVPRPRTLLPGASVAFSSPSSRRGALACLVRLMGSRHSSAAAAAAEAVEEARRGRKQLGMTPPLYDYLLANVREHPVLRELREETAAMRGSQMQVSPAQAQLLAMLVQIQGAQRCIEVGVFTIDVKHALAADSLRSLLDCGEASSYDFAFVDADKRMYEEYFELLLKLVRVGGLIVMDNVLWYGRVADPLVDDQKTISIRNFNKKVLEDMRVDISMVPIGDGMTICRKLVDT